MFSANYFSLYSPIDSSPSPFLTAAFFLLKYFIKQVSKMRILTKWLFLQINLLIPQYFQINWCIYMQFEWHRVVLNYTLAQVLG